MRVESLQPADDLRGAFSSSAELAQMMIHVQIAPAHPFPFGHDPKEGMRPQFGFVRLHRKPLKQFEEFALVEAKVSRWRAPCVRITLRYRGNAVRPPQRKP